MEEIYSDNFPMNETICKDCAFRMSRVITPIDPEDFGLTEEDMDEIALEVGECILIERHTCMIDQSDMDYIVRDCNHFRDMKAGSLILNDIYS